MHSRKDVGLTDQTQTLSALKQNYRLNLLLPSEKAISFALTASAISYYLSTPTSAPQALGFF